MDTAVSTEVVSTVLDYLPHSIDPKAVEQALLIGDISQMSDEVRSAYYIATCRSVGLNPLTRPFQALKGDDGKISLYPDKGCAEQLRKLHRVSVKVVGRELLDDLYVVTVRASTPDGREEEAQGVVPIAKAKGTWEQTKEGKRYFKTAVDAEGKEMTLPLSVTERAAAMMRCETKAKRRVTLAICGLGMPDWEQEPGSVAYPMALTLQAPTAPTELKPLAETIAEVYGDAQVQPAGEAGAEYLARIEAAILAQPGGDVERVMAWAERTLLKKDRHLFTVEDYQRLLSAVEAAAQSKGAKNLQEGTQQPRGATEASKQGAVVEADPGTGEVISPEATLLSTLPVLDQDNVFEKMEREASS